MAGPDVWGPHGWKFIHYVTLGYPTKPTDEQKQKYKTFLTLLGTVLPCSICANHFTENLVNLPLDDDVMSTRENLIKWGIDIHNIVNESRNKPIIEYKDARNMIDSDTKCKKKTIIELIHNNVKSDDSKSDVKCSTIPYELIGAFLCLIVIAVVYKRKNSFK
jgi:hypothetical protein